MHIDLHKKEGELHFHYNGNEAVSRTISTHDAQDLSGHAAVSWLFGEEKC